MASLGPAPKAQFFAANGQPLVGGKVYTYAAGTTTPLATYTSSSAASANTNPIILDGRGECNLWFSPTNQYKIKLTDSEGVEIYTVDNIANSGYVSGGFIVNSVISNNTLTNNTISGGSIDNVVIGATTPSSATFTSFSGVWASLPTGTKMLFVQTNAPTGWTKSTAHDNKALRVVSGVASSGGSVSFTSAFTSQAVTGSTGSYVLTTADIPSHSHSATSSASDSGHTHGYTAGGSSTVALSAGGVPVNQSAPSGATSSIGNANISVSTVIGNTGGGGGHSHSFTGTSINLNVQYVDVIVATKN